MYDGSYGFVHGGGLMVALLDVIAAGLELRPDVQPGHVGSLTVRFHAPLPVGQRVEFEGRFDRAEGRKTFFTSVARTGDTLIASAEAVCIAPRTELTV
jgi:acyl-coenzyme A thioesterase PaaI-like protein